MKYISRVVEIEALKIIGVCKTTVINEMGVDLDDGSNLVLVSSQPIVAGDYVNISDPSDIYHMPAKIIDGPNAKYGPIIKAIPESPIVCFFAYKHLPERLQEISKPIAQLADLMDSKLKGSAEKSAGLRKLLEAKDCFVRAFL